MRFTMACARANPRRKKRFFSYRNQALGVAVRVSGQRQNGVIASHLSLQGEMPLNPPHGGMEEEKRLEDLLGKIRPIVEAAQMSQFMDEDRVQLCAGKFVQRP